LRVLKTLALLGAWTLICFVALAFWPMPTFPSCAGLVNETTICAAEVNAFNEQLRLTHTLPLTLLLLGGYAAIVGRALWIRRRGPRSA
jgi:hypothetical protein